MRFLVALSLLLSLSACGGLEGPAGPPGPPGAPGVGLVESVTCTARQPIASSDLTLDYQRYDFSDGSVMAVCSIRDGFYEYGSTSLYKPDQTGGTQGACAVAYDVDTPSSGSWEFSSGRDVGPVRYIDPSSAWNSHLVNLACTRS
jgi:hypothetical protein